MAEFCNEWNLVASRFAQFQYKALPRNGILGIRKQGRRGSPILSSMCRHGFKEDGVDKY